MQVQVVLALTLFCFVYNTRTAMNKPPPYQKTAYMARYIVHNTNWTVVASTSKPFHGVPFGNVESFCDGPVNISTGIPYFYLSVLDYLVPDVEHGHPKVTATMSLTQTGYCYSKGYDPEDPRCARVTLIGSLINVTNALELKFSRQALFSRHPSMKYWPHGPHRWSTYKINITEVVLLDYFGGAAVIPRNVYFDARL